MISPLHILIASMLFNAFFVMIIAFNPGCLRLAVSRFRGRSLVLRMTKRGSLVIDDAENKLELMETKSGIYEFEPEDAFRFNGCPAILAYESYNTGANPKIIAYITHLKTLGFHTYSSLVNFLNVPEDKLPEQNRDQLKELQETIKNDAYVLDKVEIVKLRDLQNYLRARNPAAVKGVIEREVYKDRMKNANPLNTYFPYIIGAVVLLFGLAMAYRIMSTGDASGAAEAASTSSSALGIR